MSCCATRSTEMNETKGNSLSYIEGINRNNFNPVSVAMVLDKLDVKETKRLLKEACYCIADMKMKNEIDVSAKKNLRVD